MKTNKSIKLISSLLIFAIIFSLTISVSIGCERDEEPNPLGGVVDDPEANAAFYSFFIALGIAFLGEEIKEKKALAKAVQEATEEEEAQAAVAQESMEEELESVKAEYEAQYDFREDFINNLINGPGGAEALEENKKSRFLMLKIIEYGRAKEKQDSENQNTSATTVPQEQETTQTTEEETTQTTEEETTQTTEEETTQTTEEEKPTGTITLILNFGCGGEMIINFDTGAVTGSYYCTSELEDGEIGVGTGAFSGSIDIDTGAITASGSGDYTAYEETETFPITLVGTLSSDHASATGTMTNKWGEVPWTGAAQ